MHINYEKIDLMVTGMFFNKNGELPAFRMMEVKTNSDKRELLAECQLMAEELRDRIEEEICDVCLSKFNDYIKEMKVQRSLLVSEQPMAN